jgi:predicted MPP superfamily phosphohydrolase
VLEPVRLLVGWRLRRSTPAADPDRRLFLARSVAVVAGAAAVGVTGYGVYEAFGPPRLVRTQLPLARLGRAMDGYRIALISDIHCGPLLGAEHVRRLVTTVNAIGVDLVAITGDLADGTVAELGRAAEPLRELRPRDGSFFVTGNHEYYADDVPAWLEALRGWGVRPLVNERVELSRGGAALDLAGVNDPTGVGYGDPPDFGRAVGDRDPSRPVVLLAHQPVHVSESRQHGVDLQLSGHTHGGQMCPFNLAVGLQQPVVAGHRWFGQTQLYVTRGAGFWGPPVRVGAPPEIVIVELRAP